MGRNGRQGNQQKGKTRVPKPVPVTQRIRSVKRLLNKPNLPANVRVTQERILRFLENKVQEGEATNKRLMGHKYKKVKFFEKRKLWRQFKAANKEVQDPSSSDRLKELKELQKKIMRDLNYVEYYPYDKKYISLFPKQPYDNADVISEQATIHRDINKKVDSGELPPATFSQNLEETAHIHLDKRKSSKEDLTKDNGHVNCGLDEDDFFMK